MDGGSRGLVFSSPSCFNCRSNGVKRNFRNPEVKPSRFTSFTSGTLSYSSHTFERRCFSCRFTCCKTSRFKVISHLSCFHKIGPVINFYICFFLSLSLSLSFREISVLHMEALVRFKRATPHLEFPALHKELFSVDS